VISVTLVPGQKACRVVVPDDQLSLAIGKEGQNARLAARLTGYKIDIKSETQAAELMGLDQTMPEGEGAPVIHADDASDYESDYLPAEDEDDTL